MADRPEIVFNHELLNRIRFRQNDQAKSMLTEELVTAHDPNVGSLLHFAARWGNEVIAQKLIELGCEVDSRGEDNKTPLITAVQTHMDATVVKILLDAKADIHATDDEGHSAFQVVFHPDYPNVGVIQTFLQKAQTDGFSIQQLVDQLLIERGCSCYHAACLRDTALLEHMLARGISIDSRGPFQRTALYVAVHFDDLILAKWLVDRGIDVNATDETGFSALYFSAWYGMEAMVRLLLEHGANPNIKTDLRCTPLFMTCATSSAAYRERYDNCVELLLEYGAIPENSDSECNTIFDYALYSGGNKQIEFLIAHLVLLEKMGTITAKSVMFCNDSRNKLKLAEFDETYRLCHRLLTSHVSETFTLFDLFVENETNMKTHVRNEALLSNINCACDELNECCLYYAKMMRKRVAKALEAVKMEEKAILILCKLFRSNHNQFYSIGRTIIAYLSIKDIKNLAQL